MLINVMIKEWIFMKSHYINAKGERRKEREDKRKQHMCKYLRLNADRDKEKCIRYTVIFRKQQFRRKDTICTVEFNKMIFCITAADLLSSPR